VKTVGKLDHHLGLERSTIGDDCLLVVLYDEKRIDATDTDEYLSIMSCDAW
jgi:hypothetical protein